jgi:hypothetical protein
MDARMSVGRCCCGGATGCQIGLDSFDRADSTDINTGSPVGWSEVTGNPEILSNRLSFSGAGIALCSTSQAGSDPRFRLVSNVQASAEGGTARYLFDYVDTNNYKIVETVFGTSGAVRLIDRIGGSETTRAELIASNVLNTDARIALCYNVGQATVHFYQQSASQSRFLTYNWGPLADVNGVVALACSADGGGAVSFDSFDLAKHYSLQMGCPGCSSPCLGCSFGAPPGMRVELSNLGNARFDCSPFNTTYDLPLSGRCYYELDFTALAPDLLVRPTDRHFMYLTLTSNHIGMATIVDLYVTISQHLNRADFRDTFGATFAYGADLEDCTLFSDKLLPLFSFSGPLCMGDNLEARITSLL